MINCQTLNKYYMVKKRYNNLHSYAQNIFQINKQHIHAIDNLNLIIPDTEIVGIVGKDGAGKTTILKIMMGIIKPTSGTVEVEGLSPYSKRRKHVNNIGFVGVKTGQFKWEDSLFETLSLLKKIYNIPNDKYNDNLEIYNNFLQLEEFGHYPIKKLDYNQRICCQIVTALIHDPKIFLGDEILEGLNPVFKSKVIDLLKYLNKEKKCTIICTAKEIEDVTGICNRIILVNQGKIVDDYYNN